MPKYGLAGLLTLIVSEVAMLAHLEPFWSWHTPIAWTGYILLVDAVVRKARGSSWLTTYRREFLFLALASIPLWLVFEGYNLLIRNWHYVNLPENMGLRYFGYAWAFATIWPGIFETADLVAVIRGRSDPSSDRIAARGVGRVRPGWLTAVSALGGAMLVWPVFWPSPYLAAPVFLGFVFLLDPLNREAGDESLFADLLSSRTGKWDRLINLILGGFICGFLWEFWNYWARSKWIYTVPILPEVKIFEMPVLGFFGFPAFALECFAMYVLLRRLVLRSNGRPVGLLPA